MSNPTKTVIENYQPLTERSFPKYTRVMTPDGTGVVMDAREYSYAHQGRKVVVWIRLDNPHRYIGGATYKAEQLRKTGEENLVSVETLEGHIRHLQLTKDNLRRLEQQNQKLSEQVARLETFVGKNLC